MRIALLRAAAIAVPGAAIVLWPTIAGPVLLAAGVCCWPIVIAELRKERRQP